MDEGETGAQHCACPFWLKSIGPVCREYSGPSRSERPVAIAILPEHGKEWSWLLFLVLLPLSPTDHQAALE